MTDMTSDPPIENPNPNSPNPGGSLPSTGLRRARSLRSNVDGVRAGTSHEGEGGAEHDARPS